jgi:hypothetical protein
VELLHVRGVAETSKNSADCRRKQRGAGHYRIPYAIHAMKAGIDLRLTSYKSRFAGTCVNGYKPKRYSIEKQAHHNPASCIHSSMKG